MIGMRTIQRVAPRFVPLCLNVGAALLLSSSFFLTPQESYALSKPAELTGLALSPPLGWNDYYSFGCNPTDQLIRTTADAMVSSGMRDAGYQYVNIDDCWAMETRDRNGNLVPERRKFPHGLKPVADYVHSRGLKIGIYTAASTLTCGGRPGILGHEQQDIDLFASWGIDFVKVDWCNNNGINAQEAYNKIRDAIANTKKRTGKSMVFSICNWGEQSPWVWGPGTGHMWRTWYDISWYKDTPQFQTEDHWGDVLRNLDKNSAHAPSAGPDSWNDPDIIQIGLGTLTPVEERAHFSMWAIMAAPILAGNDLRVMPDYIRDMYTNREVLAVNQDPLGIQGVKVSEKDGLQVWSKRLQGAGARAVALFNRTADTANITVNWPEIGLTEDASVRDLWAKQDIGIFHDSLTAQVPAHGIVLLKLQGSESNDLMILSLSSGLGQSESTVDDASIGSVAWTNPWDAFTSNNLYSYVTLSGQDSHAIKATSFKLAVPDNSQVTGIQVDVEKKSTRGFNKDASVILLKNGSRTGIDHADIISPWPTNDTYTSYGGQNDSWGTTWTPDEINGPGFGVAISSRSSPGSPSDTSYVDNIRITVYYYLLRP